MKAHNDTAALSVYEPVTLRQTGAFHEVNPDFHTPNATRTSGDYQVEIDNGNDDNSLNDFIAYFQTDNGNSIHSGFNFDVEHNLGGAGFSHCSDVGVVLSGNAVGASDFVFIRIDLDNPSDTDSYTVVFQDGAYEFQPRIQFSPDCTLMLIAGAQPIHPANNSLKVWDLLEDRVIGQLVTFNTGQFSAEVVPEGNRFAIKIIVDNGTPIIYSIP